MRNLSISQRVAALGAGVLGYSLIEYVHHRYGGHVKGWGNALYVSHQRHHGDPPEGGVTYREKLRQRLPLVSRHQRAFRRHFSLCLAVLVRDG